jgi:class 3 adenylate cyclase
MQTSPTLAKSLGVPRRFDFVADFVKIADDPGAFEARMLPDPRRYETVDVSGKQYFRDRYLDELISKDDMFARLVREMSGLPIYSLNPRIDSTAKYALARREAVESELRTGEHVLPAETALSHRNLEANPSSRDLAFISVDICRGSTLRKWNSAGFDQAYKVFLQELGTVVGHFNGVIFKHTGDGFISFVDFPAFTRQCDNAVDMGLSFVTVLHRTINPALSAAGLPTLSIRVGADFGLADVKEIRVPATGFLSLDIVSDALNRSVKIEQSCHPNEFRIGRSLYEVVHVTWLERAKEVEFDGRSVGIPNYRAYKIT